MNNENNSQEVHEEAPEPIISPFENFPYGGNLNESENTIISQEDSPPGTHIIVPESIPYDNENPEVKNNIQETTYKSTNLNQQQENFHKQETNEVITIVPKNEPSIINSQKKIEPEKKVEQLEVEYKDDVNDEKFEKQITKLGTSLTILLFIDAFLTLIVMIASGGLVYFTLMSIGSFASLNVNLFPYVLLAYVGYLLLTITSFGVSFSVLYITWNITGKSLKTFNSFFDFSILQRKNGYNGEEKMVSRLKSSFSVIRPINTCYIVFLSISIIVVIILLILQCLTLIPGLQFLSEYVCNIASFIVAIFGVLSFYIFVLKLVFSFMNCTSWTGCCDGGYNAVEAGIGTMYQNSKVNVTSKNEQVCNIIMFDCLMCGLLILVCIVATLLAPCGL